MEHKLRPGMITLTWTSMNIDSFIQHISKGLKQLRELISNINGIIENRIEKNLKIVSRTLLIDLPENSSFTVSDFVALQKVHITKRASILQGKNIEVQSAVDDLVEQIAAYFFESPSDTININDIEKLRAHYNHFMYKALLNSAKNSMNILKKRIGSRGGTSIINSSKPFFNVDVQLMPPQVTLSPSLDQIQECISTTAQTILSCYKSVIWVYRSDPKSTTTKSFFDSITKDIEIVRVALLLTGCMQGVRKTVAEYLSSFVEVS
jgi:dynein heavy chain